MRVNQLDLALWTRKRAPALFDHLRPDPGRSRHYGRADLIHQIIYSRTHPNESQRDVNVGNAVSLLRIVRANLQHDNYTRAGLPGEDYRSLAEYMLRYRQKDGRLPYYRRWLRRMGYLGITKPRKGVSA